MGLILPKLRQDKWGWAVGVGDMKVGDRRSGSLSTPHSPLLLEAITTATPAPPPLSSSCPGLVVGERWRCLPSLRARADGVGGDTSHMPRVWENRAAIILKPKEGWGHPCVSWDLEGPAPMGVQTLLPFPRVIWEALLLTGGGVWPLFVNLWE